MNEAVQFNGVSYLDQTPEVAARFERLKQRPVVLDVRNLTRQFATAEGVTTALQDVSFQAFRREFLCIIGPSGCGKSTLIRILAGLDEATSGAALLDGQPIRKPGPERGMVFQGYTLFPWLSVKRNIAFGLEMSGMARREAEAEARQWAALVGLSKFENAYPNQLSGGMKQRVAIARALAAKPRILIMDEPFGALDAQTRAQMQSYLLQIWKNVDVTILFITHDLDEAVYLADRILVLEAHPGRVREMIEVPVPRPRSLDQISTPIFQATRLRVDELIHCQAQHLGAASAAPSEEIFPIVRLTNVDDNVE
jgi:NitT/TauT family transport system ATP-binding protein